MASSVPLTTTQDHLSDPWRILSATVNGVIKVFMFFPSLTIFEDTNLFYEIARWLAPMGTLLGFFTLFENFYHRFKTLLVNRKRPLAIVFGQGAFAEYTLKALSTDGGGYLISQEDMEEEKLDSLHRQGMDQIRWNRMGREEEIPVLFHHLKGDHIKELVLMEDELENFRILTKLNKVLPERKNAYPVLYRYENYDIKEIAAEQIDSMDQFDVRFLNFEDLMVYDLMKRDFCFSHFDRDWNKNRTHVLLLSFNDTTKAFLRELANVGVVHVQGKVHVCLVTNRGEELEAFQSHYDAFSKIFNLRVLRWTANSYRKLREIHKEDPFTAIIATGDLKDSLLLLSQMRELTEGIDLAIRCDSAAATAPFVVPIGKRASGVFLYGGIEQLLQEKNLLEPERTENAKRFNALYHRTLSRLLHTEETRTPEQLWNDLSTLKKESSLEQSLHRGVKERILLSQQDLVPGKKTQGIPAAPAESGPGGDPPTD